MAQESEKGHAAVHSPLPLVCLLRRQPEVQVLRVGRGGEGVLQPRTPARASSPGPPGHQRSAPGLAQAPPPWPVRWQSRLRLAIS